MNGEFWSQPNHAESRSFERFDLAINRVNEIRASIREGLLVDWEEYGHTVTDFGDEMSFGDESLMIWYRVRSSGGLFTVGLTISLGLLTVDIPDQSDPGCSEPWLNQVLALLWAILVGK